MAEEGLPFFENEVALFLLIQRTLQELFYMQLQSVYLSPIKYRYQKENAKNIEIHNNINTCPQHSTSILFNSLIYPLILKN
jgi:hypothetical protein